METEVKKKRDDKSIDFRDWTSPKLKREVQSLNDTVYGVNSCYGVGDLILLDQMMAELRKRGYEIEESSDLCIHKAVSNA